MRNFGAVVVASVVLSGCTSVGPTLSVVPTTSQATVPSTQPTQIDPVLTPVAASKTAAAAKAGSAALAPVGAKASAASPADPTSALIPKSAGDVQQAMQVLTAGLKTADGKPFNLFDTANPPADAVVTSDPSLASAASSPSGYSVQSTPDDTQTQADQEAAAWSPDAQQIWVGWGYWGRWAPLSIFGQSRHVYYSDSKHRLLYLDYDFFRLQKSRWESDNIVMTFAGKYLTDVLEDARGRFPYTGWMAFNQARQSGYSYDDRTAADIKAICIEPIFVGPKWIFFDSANKPAMLVDANSGEVTDSGWLMDIIRTLSFFSP